ncbi:MULTISPECIES: hypothetical protein [unclassified Clostridium]|nr:MULTISPECIES: hypothetical protein [unclassified Clostridium]NFG62555.1 hypothetical protein [Clostridium botulinum]NFQ10756.1 hypothetical protein [Clostridium botulinum]
MKKKVIAFFCGVICTLLIVGCSGGSKVKELTDQDTKTYAEQMKEDPLSGDINLNGVKLSLPINVKTLADNGFKFNDYDHKSQELENDYYVDDIIMDDGKKGEDTRIRVTIYNNSGTTVKLDDAKIGEIKIKKSKEPYKNTVVLPKGITLNSTYDDVINAYGKPKVDYMNEAGFVNYFTSDIGEYGQKMEIYFDKTTKVVDSIELKNIPYQ